MTVQQPNSFRTGPDERGHFGIYGGRFVAETLMPLIFELEQAYNAAKSDPAFKREMDGHLAHYVGRPSPLYFAERLTAHLGGAKIYLKREDLNHTGAHKINNVLGQILLAKRMGKTRIIAETGAGQHGVATATVCAMFGLEVRRLHGRGRCRDARQLNVFRMQVLGAKVVPVEAGSKTLKDAINEAMRDWVTNVAQHALLLLGTVSGPHPYPMMVRDFQRVIGDETREQILENEERLPDSLIACVGGGSNAMGLFYPFLDDKEIEIYRRGSGRSWPQHHHARGLDCRRPARRVARQSDLSVDERGRPDHRGAFDLGRARLSRHRPRACLAEGHRPRHVPVGDRRRGVGRVSALLQA